MNCSRKLLFTFVAVIENSLELGAGLIVLPLHNDLSWSLHRLRLPVLVIFALASVGRLSGHYFS